MTGDKKGGRVPKKRVTVVVCALCDDSPAEVYSMKLPDGRKVKVDLCRRHAQPILHLVSQLPQEYVATPPRRGLAGIEDMIVDIDAEKNEP